MKHEVEIVYCVPCGLLPQAEKLKNDLKKNIGADVKLKEGDKGVFDVFVDGKLVFSRHKEGRFPASNEIIKMVS